MKYFVFAAVLVLAGCQNASVPVEQAPPPESVVQEVVEEAPAPVVVAPPKPHIVIDTILNLAPDTLRNILGNPSLTRREKQAEVWLYRNPECVLHLYFYPNENGDFRLDYVETSGARLSADNPTVSPNACLESHVMEGGPTLEITPDPQPSYPDSDTDPLPDRPDS